MTLGKFCIEQVPVGGTSCSAWKMAGYLSKNDNFIHHFDQNRHSAAGKICYTIHCKPETHSLRNEVGYVDSAS